MKIVLFSIILAWFLNSSAYSAVLSGQIKIKRVRNLADTVVCLESKGVLSINLPPINPMMDQRKLEFIPHVLVIPVGATVDFLNNDEAKHNVFSPDKIADKFDFGYYSPGDIAKHTFKKTGVASILCNKHDEMEAFIFICDSHLHSKTGRKGEFSIEDVPPGEYTLKVWNKKMRKQKSSDISVTDENLRLNLKFKK